MGFSVEEAYVAGFGRLGYDLHGQLLSTLVHVHEARPEGGYTGLMELAKAPIDSYCDLTGQRIASRSSLVGALPDELNLLAWRYHTTDVTAYERFEQIPVPPFQQVTILDFPNPVPFSAGTAPALDVPGHSEPPIQDLIDEVGGSINGIDWVIKKVSGWSAVEAIVEPLSGNWTELERAAEVLTNVGNACEQVATNLTSQLGRLGGHWTGGAAASFEDYATRIGAALDIEGPINRLVAGVLEQVAGEVEAAAEFMVSTLKEAVDKIASTIATGWIPGIGWYKVYDTAKTVINVFQEAKQLVESLQETIEMVQTVVDAASDPVGFVTDYAREQLQPYLDGAEVAADIASLDPEAITEAPTEEYTPGEDIRRAG